MISQSLEDSCIAQNRTLSHGCSQDVDNFVQITKHKHQGCVYPFTFNSESSSIHHNAAAEYGPVANKIPAATLTGVAVVEILHIITSDGVFYISTHSKMQRNNVRKDSFPC